MDMGAGLSHRTLREQIADILRRQIFNGDIQPGEKIKESELAAAFAVSRGPVREALRQIEQEGLVEYSANKGCTVRILTYENIEEVYLIRSELERLAVKIYDGKMSQEGLDSLDEIAQQLGQAARNRDLYEIIKYDEAFHARIVEEAGSGRLSQTWGIFAGDNAATYYTMKKEDLMPLDYLERNHRYILDELKSGTLDSICQRIEKHYMIVPATLYQKLKENRREKNC